VLPVARAGRVAWYSSDLIAYDALMTNGYYGVFTMSADGSHQVCLTNRSSALPKKNIGNPVWAPGGQYLAIQVQNPALSSTNATPGGGRGNNLWIIKADGSNPRQVTKVTASGGVLHPQFSGDGTRIAWAQRIGEADGTPSGAWGIWEIQVGDFTPNAATPVTNIKTFRPGKFKKYYEPSSFSADGKSIYFSGTLDGQSVYNLNIYRMDLASGTAVNLVNDLKQWYSYAHLSPDGKTLVFASSRGIPQRSSTPGYRLAEYFISDPNGANPRQITHFNDRASHDWLAMPKGSTAADLDFSPDGKKLVGYVIDPNPSAKTGALVMVTITPSGS
jgi:Tol biopolymer transport system component